MIQEWGLLFLSLINVSDVKLCKSQIKVFFDMRWNLKIIIDDEKLYMCDIIIKKND